MCNVVISGGNKIAINVPVQGGHEPVRTHDDGTFRKLVLVLLNTPKIISRRVGLTNRTGSEVHDFVPVATNVSVQLCHTKVCPVATDHCEHMTKSVRPIRRVGEYDGETRMK